MLDQTAPPNPLRVLGAVTIGQSPRVDLTPEMLPLLGKGTQVIEVGALDPLSPEEIAALAPQPGESVLVSRLRDGSQATIALERLLPHVQRAFDSLAGRVGAIMMLCTGTLPPFESPHPALYPEHLLFHVVKGILGEGEAGGHPPLGVITPVAEQVADQRERWGSILGVEPAVAACSPYVAEGRDEGLRAAGLALKEAGVRLIVLDCLGYSQQMKRIVHEATGLPVLLARTVLARITAELVDDGSGGEL